MRKKGIGTRDFFEGFALFSTSPALSGRVPSEPWLQPRAVMWQASWGHEIIMSFSNRKNWRLQYPIISDCTYLFPFSSLYNRLFTFCPTLPLARHSIVRVILSKYHNLFTFSFTGKSGRLWQQKAASFDPLECSDRSRWALPLKVCFIGRWLATSGRLTNLRFGRLW